MSIFRDTTGGIFADRIRKVGEHRAADAEPSHARPQDMRLPRDPVFADATLILTSGKVAAAVTNVNAMGVRVEFRANVTLRGDIVIVVPRLGLNRHARVAWQHNGSAGLAFVKQDHGAA
jgi:hypothetical protein